MSVAPTPRTKGSHFRSIHHLRHFADSRGQLWVSDRSTGRSYQQIPANVGKENYLYAPECGSSPHDDAFERWITTTIDSPAGAPIARLATMQTIAWGDRSRVARYVAVQDMRTPKCRDVLLVAYQAEADQVWPGDAAGFCQFDANGIARPMEALAEFAAGSRLVVQKPAWLSFVAAQVNRAGRRVFQMEWSVVRAPAGVEYLTNDVGVVKCRGSFESPVSHSLGWSEGVDHWVVPLGSHTALALAPPTIPTASLVVPVSLGDSKGISCWEAHPAWVEMINRQSVRDATRFVYSGSNHQAILVEWNRP